MSKNKHPRSSIAVYDNTDIAYPTDDEIDGFRRRRPTAAGHSTKIRERWRI